MDQRKLWAHHLWQELLAIPGSRNFDSRQFNRNVFLLMSILLAGRHRELRDTLSAGLLDRVDELVEGIRHLPSDRILPRAQDIQHRLFDELNIPQAVPLDLGSRLIPTMLEILAYRFSEVEDPLYLADVAFHRSIERPRVSGRRLTDATHALASVLLPTAPRLVDYFLETGDLAVRFSRRNGDALRRATSVEVHGRRITSNESLLKLRFWMNDVSVYLDNEEVSRRNWSDSLVVLSHPRHRTTTGQSPEAPDETDPSALHALSNLLGRTAFRLAVVAVPARDAVESGWRRDFRRYLVNERYLLAVIGGFGSLRSSSNQDTICLVTSEPRPVDDILFINVWGLGKNEEAELSDVMHFVARTVNLLSGMNPLRDADFGHEESEKLLGRFSRAFRTGYRNVTGLCRLVHPQEIEAKNWSLAAPAYITPAKEDHAAPQLDSQPVLEALDQPFPVRAYVIGNNGQGKSLLLAQLAEELAQRSRPSGGLSFGLTDRFPFNPDGQIRDGFMYLGARTSETGISMRSTKKRLEESVRTIRSSWTRLDAFRSALKTLGFGQRLYVIPGSIILHNGTIPESAFGKVEELTALSPAPEALSIGGAFSLGVIRNDADNRVVMFERLSSGEQQLITLAAKLSAKAEKGMVMLVDEPELSLHVRWQLAIPSMLADLSERLQCSMVVATHSAVLIASALEQDYCFVASKQVLKALPPHQRPSVESVLFDDFDTYTKNTRRVHELCAAMVSETIHEVNGGSYPKRRNPRDRLEQLRDISRIVKAAPAQQDESQQRDLALIERTRAAIEELFAQMRAGESRSREGD